jgi:spermidine/putrescine transport system permease protein
VNRYLSLYASAAYAFLYLPLAVLAVFSFNASRFAVWQGFTWRWYGEIFQDERLIEATIRSVEIAICATIFSTVIGTLAAYAIWKRRARWLTNSLYLSLVTPEIVTGVSLLAFFQWIFRFLHVQLGMHTVILAHISFSVAYAVIVILARLRTFDRALEEAALDLGAHEWQVFCRVTAPNLLPAIGAAALLCFTVSFDDYVITSLVAGVNSETLPMVIYSLARRGVSPAVNALSAIVTVGIGTVIVAAEGLQHRGGKSPS